MSEHGLKLSKVFELRDFGALKMDTLNCILKCEKQTYFFTLEIIIYLFLINVHSQNAISKVRDGTANMIVLSPDHHSP